MASGLLSYANSLDVIVAQSDIVKALDCDRVVVESSLEKYMNIPTVLEIGVAA